MKKNTLIALLNIQFMNLNESTDFIIAPTHSHLLVYGSSFANINCFYVYWVADGFGVCLFEGILFFFMVALAVKV